jgi:hypothetical protein
MNNYTDLSSGLSTPDAGFQFEFRCERCGETWRSAFKPYRRGQLAGWMSRLGYYFTGSAMSTARSGSDEIARLGSTAMHRKALVEAQTQARQLYSTCGTCRSAVCRRCWSAASGQCTRCAEEAGRSVQLDGARPSVGLACSSCGQPCGGGRFCEACGFDMASTHKSCPGCGAMVTRNARFCADCGHGF